MAIRIRIVDDVAVALCAARSVHKDGDLYLDDEAHHALSDKFAADFTSEGHGPIPHDLKVAQLREREESNNPNREWWDRTYGRPNMDEPTGWDVLDRVNAKRVAVAVALIGLLALVAYWLVR